MCNFIALFHISEGVSFSAPYDLRVFSVLGSGAYGTVVAAEKVVTPPSEGSRSETSEQEGSRRREKPVVSYVISFRLVSGGGG